MRLLTLLFLLTSALFAGKLPDITSEDVSTTLDQIMQTHASCKKFSTTLVARAVEGYLEQLDPTKTYLLEQEVKVWLEPGEEQEKEIVQAVEGGDFSVFSKIHEQMISAIERRKKLERQINNNKLPSDVSISEFKDLQWVGSEKQLLERLTRIKALQVAAADKLEKPAKEKALRRIVKRRLNHEEEILCKGEGEKERLVLSNVLKSFASAFDTHTAYFTPGEASQFMIQVQQRLFGIGAQLRDDLNGFTIVKIIDGGPASRDTGLRANDRVIAIDKEPVVGMAITDAVELIRGEEGTTVNLTVLRPVGESEEKLEIPITRGEVVIKEARIESNTIPFGDGVIAHVALHAFYQDPMHSSSSDLYEEISKISREHLIKGIVLDLRLNSGGVLPQAVAVTGLFITKGIVVSIKDNNGRVEHLRDVDGKTAYDGPLVVLTSKASASAAEIVAQTLQDYGRAIVVGDEHTYGKGTFQTFTLDASGNGKINPKGEFKVTRGRYYTVSGKSPQLVGVKPDIVVPGLYTALEIGERYAKYPLENDSIAENFHDDLSDIPAVQRDQISWLYRFNLQTRLKTYTRYLPILRNNSERRVKNDLVYQRFLDDLEEEDLATDRIEFYGKQDLQLRESTSVMKDLILLLK